MPPLPTPAKWIAFTGLAVGLACLTLVQVFDLDFGFYLAAGQRALQQGLDTEFYLPQATPQPWSSPWLLAAPVFALAWEIAGPAGLIALKVLGYSAGFLFAFQAACLRRTAPWLAALLAILAAVAVAPRFVERPGLFSAAFLGGFVWAGSSGRVQDFLRSRTVRASALIATIFVVWAFLHAEWYLGLAVLATSLLQARLPIRRIALLFFSATVAPILAFQALHPAGAVPLFGPFRLLFGGGVDFGIAEYQASTWSTMPGAIPLLISLLMTAVWLWRNDQRWEAVLIAGLVLLSTAIPRAVLPAAIVGLPGLAQAVATLPRLPVQLPRRGQILAAVLCASIGWVGVHSMPWRQLGLGMDPTLDVHGIGRILDQIAPSEGPLLATYGWSSLLLSQPGTVRHGIIMDGRQEAYTDEYVRDVYIPLMNPGPDWQIHVDAHQISFYCEPFSGRAGGQSLMEHFESIGWELIGWDNSSRLMARPGLAHRHSLKVLRFDPDRLDRYQPTPETLEAASREIIARVHELEEAGFPSTRGRLAHAHLALGLGRLEQAADSLESATRQEGPRYLRYWVLRAELAMAEGDLPAAEAAATQIAGRGAPAQAHVVRAEVALREGRFLDARREIQSALDVDTALRDRLEPMIRELEALQPEI